MILPLSYGIVVPSVYGPVIINRYDTFHAEALIKTGYGLNHDQIVVLCGFLQSAPPGAVCVDVVAANYGLYALAFARELASKNGRVHAFEAQRMFAYMAAGTAALNGVENLVVHHKAIGAEPGFIPVPQFDYNKVCNFSGVEFGPTQTQAIGQERSSQPERQEYVEVARLDDLRLENVHLVKIDIEGMEESALHGASRLIERDRPILCVEWVKSDKQNLISFFRQRGYRVFDWGRDFLCVHQEKPAGYYPVNIQLPEM